MTPNTYRLALDELKRCETKSELGEWAERYRGVAMISLEGYAVSVENQKLDLRC